MIRHILAAMAVTLTAALTAYAADPTATDYTVNDCLGSQRPYPDIDDERQAVPDSLTVVFVNHVGRHGARFPASPRSYTAVQTALMRADSLGTITPTGRRLLAIVGHVTDYAHNRWGALDSLGMAEQRGIASRMFRNYSALFDSGTVNAISSYSPRCVMSMYEFTHQLDRLNNNVEIRTSSGRVNSPLMRPFDTDRDYLDFMRRREWQGPYELYLRTTVPASVVTRLLGDKYPIARDEAQDLAMDVYGVVAGWAAMGLPYKPEEFVSRADLNSLWSVFNLRQYLQRTATTLSAVPADIASDLLLDLINTTDAAAGGKAPASVCLRFGHAETLMPLLSLMKLRGCNYLTNYFDTVGLHWRDFDVVPMAANLQLILFKDRNGRYLVRVDLNETPVPLMPDSDALYTPWDVARQYLLRQVPLYLQP